ncbi:hypothetical protein [Micromonospora tarensis]|uniref:Uncharacterized protein n=1 Tax=Micromonospora tarensis TaxID=2806100 RepID=A0ABS1YQ05_9ACTN|nr:hypothetical protein [Micromonospora tarensis]MBM0279506.1 hypothetical protein [Micromonospora tarensis]
MRTDLHGPLAGYARRLHATAGDRHHVASALGAWLLLAVGAAAAADADPSTEDPAAEELAHALGTDVTSAAEVARALLDAPASAGRVRHRALAPTGQGNGGPATWRAAAAHDHSRRHAPGPGGVGRLGAASTPSA